MAEKKTMTFDAIMRNLKERQFSPVYFLMGDEAYFIDQIANYIADNALAPEERDFNQTIVFGADTNAAQLADLARRYPMMAERQVVIVKEAQNIKSWDALEKYFEKPVASTILVICYKNGTVDRRKRVISMADQHGVVFESSKKRDYELPGFISSYLLARAATIDNKSAQMMADFIGADLSRMASELDKLLLSLPENDRRITPELVEKQIGVSKDFNPFELKNAIVARDVMKANMIIKYFDKNPKAGSLFSFLPLLFNYFQNLMIAYYAPNRHDENEVARFLEMKSKWSVREIMTGMRNYSGVKVMQIISKFREIDAKSKGLDNPNTGAGELAKELIFFILH